MVGESNIVKQFASFEEVRGKVVGGRRAAWVGGTSGEDLFVSEGVEVPVRIAGSASQSARKFSAPRLVKAD